MARRGARIGQRICGKRAVIFVTVGAQLPFPRMLRMVAEAVLDDRQDIFAQTADPAYDGPLHSAPFLARDEFEQRCREAELIVGHAGMGTVLAARRHAKPLIVIVRRHELGEHRNDHQLATGAQLDAAGLARTAETSEQLAMLIADPPAFSDAHTEREKTKLIDRLVGLIGSARP